MAIDPTMKKLLKILLEQEDGDTQAGQNVPAGRSVRTDSAPAPSSGAHKDMRSAERSRQVAEDLGKTRHDMYVSHTENSTNIGAIPIWEKYALSVNEATQYFHLGEGKLREIVHRDKYAPYLLWNGRKVYFKRKLFEEYLDRENEV